ncbi:MAG: amino acid ABC transporter permease [Hyphomicrobiales bacterium]
MTDAGWDDRSWVRTEDAPRLAAPANTTGIPGWLSENLFSSWTNGVLTVLFLAFVGWILSGLIDWGIVKGVFSGADREACVASPEGACWAFVWAKFPQWIYGFFPIDQRWRVNIAFVLGILGLIALLVPRIPYKREAVLFMLLVYPLVTLILLTGGHFLFSQGTWIFMLGLVALFAAVLFGLALVGRVIDVSVAVKTSIAALLLVVVVMAILSIDFGLQPVETSNWGGLLLTLVVAVTGIVASLPLGILLALGRRSNMPVVRLFSVIFIELWRGVPLISVLFMASVMLPLFLPEGVNFDKLLRCLIGVALFSSAYMAEVVRGGLQAIPKGQYEAASALGLGFWPSMGLIILPQALKIVIPGIVNSFISLFKDTTLVSIIGLFDLLGIVQSGFADAKWASPQTGSTGYFFAALMFWLFCFLMSRYSMFMERRLHTGHRR